MGQKFQCPECDYESRYKHAIATHKKSVHIGQRFQCPECDHQATQKSHLVTHQRSVHMGKKFLCPECDHQETHQNPVRMGPKSKKSKKNTRIASDKYYDCQYLFLLYKKCFLHIFVFFQKTQNQKKIA